MTTIDRLNEKIMTIFCEIQEEREITDGYIDPMDAIALDEAVARVAEIIDKVVADEIAMSKGRE